MQPQLALFLFLHLFSVHMHLCSYMSVEARGQPVGVRSFFLPCGAPGIGFGSWLSQGFYRCVETTMTEKQVGEETVNLAFTSTLLFSKEVRTGTQAGQEPGGRS